MSNRLKYWIIVFLASCNIGIFWYIAGQFSFDGLALHFLDVGQGDSQLIVTKHARVLIDTGASSRAANELDRIMPSGNRVIDMVLISHPNVDHFYGLIEIMKRYRVRLVIYSGVAADDAKFQNMLDEVRKKNIPILYARQGEELAWDGVRLKVLWPDFQFAIGESISDPKLNDTSLVTLLSYNNFDALFTGDISATIEKKLLGILSDIEVLKVAHHGSKYSTAESFVKALTPEIAIVSVGENRYGHPSAEVLGRLRVFTKEIFDTLSRGTVTIISDGFGYEVSSRK